MPEITDEQVRNKAAELILTGKTLESVEDINDEVRNSISELLVRTAGKQRKLTPEHQNLILSILLHRISLHPAEHYRLPKRFDTIEVKKALEANPTLIWSLAQMEGTGGEPDIIDEDNKTFLFVDCSAESPNRRCLSYDRTIAMAKEFGVEIMTEEDYRNVQKIGKFDIKSKIWLATPDDVKKFGNALTGSRCKDGYIDIQGCNTDPNNPNIGWRGMLRVPKV